MKIITAYINIVTAINKKIGNAVSWLSLILVLVVCYDVIVRYVVRESSVALQELEWHLFALLFMAGAAVTLQLDAHVRVDLFYTRLTKRKKAAIDLAGSLLFLIPFCLLVIYSSFDFVKFSFIVKETSPDAGGLPARYILKAFIPLSFFFLLLEGIALAFKSYIIIKEPKPYIKSEIN
jgi:TRAP-type mannitol/chloroaromatic compound transport system permease small subunit